MLLIVPVVGNLIIDLPGIIIYNVGVVPAIFVRYVVKCCHGDKVGRILDREDVRSIHRKEEK